MGILDEIFSRAPGAIAGGYAGLNQRRLLDQQEAARQAQEEHLRRQMALAESLAPSEIGLRGAQAFEHLAHGQYYLTPDTSNLSVPANMQLIVEPDFPGAQIGDAWVVPKMEGPGLKPRKLLHPDTGQPFRMAVNAGQPDLGALNIALPGGAPGYALYSRRSQGQGATPAPTPPVAAGAAAPAPSPFPMAPEPKGAAPTPGATPAQAPTPAAPRTPAARVLKDASGRPITGPLQDLTGQEYTNVQGMLDGIRKLDRAIELVRANPKLVGPGSASAYTFMFPGSLGSFARGFTERGKPGQAEFDQLVPQIKSPELFGIGGKQLTGTEKLILEPGTFDPVNPPDVVLNRLRNLRAKATRSINDYLNQFSPERGYKPQSFRMPEPSSLQERMIQRRLQSQYNP